MKRAPTLVLVLVLSAACTSKPVAKPSTSPSGPRVPLAFRIVTAKNDAKPCVPGPDYSTATTEDQWIDVWDEETSCHKQEDINLPNVDFTKEFAVVARWGPRSCDTPRILSAEIEGLTVFVDVDLKEHPCAYAIGPVRQPEAFVAIKRASQLCATTLVVLRVTKAEIAHIPWIAPPCAR